MGFELSLIDFSAVFLAWSSQSPHYAFAIPPRRGSDLVNTVSTLNYASTPTIGTSFELKDVESPPPSPHGIGLAR